jgi:hypothetical protein
MTEDRRSWDPWAPAPAVEPAPAVAEQAGDPQAAAAELPSDLDDIGKPDLIALAELAGVATYGTKQDIADRIRAAAG